MAAVYLGRALGAGGFERLVAIKSMHRELAADPTFVAMFLDEARLAARVRHPNVVATLDVEESGSGLYIVMEYVEGPSLSAMRRALGKRGEPIPAGIALRIVVDALLGLHAAHEQTGPKGEPLHIVHRDVTPQNILVSVDGVAKITDFGVARAESRLSTTRSGSAKGKLAYMPPEQVRAEPLDRRADVYAAGIVLWELLVGQRLFEAENEGALLYRVMAGAQRSPRDAGADVPEALDRAVMRSLALDPDARYPTALAFAEALEAAAAAASLPLATPRVVAAFVKELGAHRSPDPTATASEPIAEPATVTSDAPALEEAPSTGIATRVDHGRAPDSLSAPGTAVMPPEARSPARPPWMRPLLVGLVFGVGATVLAATALTRLLAHKEAEGATRSAMASPPCARSRGHGIQRRRARAGARGNVGPRAAADHRERRGCARAPRALRAARRRAGSPAAAAAAAAGEVVRGALKASRSVHPRALRCALPCTHALSTPRIHEGGISLAALAPLHT
jgi:serine/threonine-protein kinase